jgi:DNA-binding protein YbaB
VNPGREYPALDRLGALINGLTDMGSRLSERIDRLAEQSAEGISDSGHVIVRARNDGGIIDVRLDPRAMRIPSQNLAEEFLQAAKRAQEQAARMSTEAVRTLLDPVPGVPAVEIAEAQPPDTYRPRGAYDEYQDY